MTDAAGPGRLEPEAVEALIGAALTVSPRLSIAVRDAGGSIVAAAGAVGSAPPGALRTIEVDGVRMGEVVVDGPLPGDGLAMVAGLIAQALALASRTEREAHADAVSAGADPHLEHELAIGRRIQRSLMPRRFPVFDGWEIEAAYEAAREVGGDFYDAFPVQNRPGCLAFTIADVTGKGIPAAILMADARALIHAAADNTTDPAEALSRVNRILIEERATSLFVTAAHGVIDTATGRLVLASAGHDPVFVLGADGDLASLEPEGRLIGVVADIETRSLTTVVDAGAAIVAYTDGITEARAVDGAFYGEDRFADLLRSLAGRSAADIVGAVLEDVSAFRAGREASDDLTLLVIRRTVPVPSPTSPPSSSRSSLPDG